MSYVIGLDIGTTSTIGILIGLDDGLRMTASRPVALHHPHAGWAEEDPAQWWDNTCAVLQDLLRQSGLEGSAVRAVGVAGMVPAVILLDAQGRLLRPSIQQSDGRCAREVEELRAEQDADAFTRTTGNGINQQLVAAKLRWIERHEPAVFERIATVFGSYDYINWRLTGERRIEQNWALEGGFVDLADHRVSDSLVALAHLRPDQIPALARSHEVIGRVDAQAAAATGLAAGTPVIGGLADHVASAYAAGVRQPGDLLVKLGGAGDILLSTDTARPDARMFLDYHAIPGLYMPNGCMACSGALLNWFAQQFGAAAQSTDGRTRHQNLDALAAAVPPGSEGARTLPYFLGEKTPIHDPLARGTFTGLGLHHQLGHLWRSLLEGVAFGVRHHVEVFASMGLPARRILASDGGAGSRIWLQIIADVLQQPVQRLTGHPGSCLGAAWAAAIGVGLSTDWQGVARFVSLGEAVVPEPAHAAIYDTAYAEYLDLYQTLRPYFHRVATAP
ncbi:MAG TPA: FGGY-family carbohydrate kinase [Burkholderiaceae bacterium]|nr:FGGY-family carbohydrate kinase [Burkholderiaceae bacterium]